MRIPGLRGLSPSRLFKEALRQFIAQDMRTHAAAVTFHVFFSLFPFIILLIALLGFLELSSLFDWLRRRAESLFLQESMAEVNNVLDQLQRRRTDVLSLGVLASLWTASSGMRAAMRALNVVYSVADDRPLWKRYLVSMGSTLAAGFLLILTGGLILLEPQVVQKMLEGLGLAPYWAVPWSWWLRWPLVALLLTLTVALVYGGVPDVEQRFRFVTPGAFLAVCVWIAASLAFNFYAERLSSYNRLYGSVGTVIVILLYFYLTATLLLFGAEVNAVIEHHAPSGKDAGEKSFHSPDA